MRYGMPSSRQLRPSNRSRPAVVARRCGWTSEVESFVTRTDRKGSLALGGSSARCHLPCRTRSQNSRGPVPVRGTQPLAVVLRCRKGRGVRVVRGSFHGVTPDPAAWPAGPLRASPGEEAAKALWTGMAEYQVAWPFTRLSLEELGDFIDRWAGWLADAAAGKLSHPSTMPERPTQWTWRRR